MFGEHSGAVFLKVLFHKKTSFQEHPTHYSPVWAGAPSLTEGAPSHKGSNAWGSLPASQPKPPLRTFATGDPSGARPHWLRASARGRPTRIPTRRPPAPPPPPRSVAAPPIPPTPLLFFFSLHRGQMLPIREEFPLQAERPGADTPRHGPAGVSRPLLRPPLGTEPPLLSPHPPNTWSRSQAPSPAAPVPPAPYLRPGAALSAGAARRSHVPGGLRGGGAATWHGPGDPPAAAGRGSWQPAAPRRPAALGLLIARHFAEAAAVIWCPRNAHKPGGAVPCRGGV